jgi:hypothetical protein
MIEKRTAHWYSVTSLLLKPLKQRIINVTSFRLSKSLILDPFCSNVLFILVLSFQIVWTVEFTRPKSRRTSGFFFLLFSSCRIASTFLSTFKTSLLFVTVVLLSRYQSTVNCRGRNLRVQLHIQSELPFLVIFWAWNLCSYLTDNRTCPLKDEEILEFSK